MEYGLFLFHRLTFTRDKTSSFKAYSELPINLVDLGQFEEENEWKDESRYHYSLYIFL